MLLTGSKDTTARVWDVGEEFLPHADEWANIKSQSVLKSDTDVGDLISAQKTAPADNSALKTTVVGANTTGEKKSSNAATSSIVARTGEKDRQASVWKDRGMAKKEEGSMQERACRAAVKFRSELLRQAGARPQWRTGCITSIMDPTGVGPQPRVLTEAGKNSEQDHIIEVRHARTK